MPKIPSTSLATGATTGSSYIHTTDCNFVDNAGRTLLLRGVNLSGSSKAPVGRPSYILDGFWENAENGTESFVGRPLNIDDGSADVHLARLKGWGFNMLRFPVTWEALEHSGPRQYDFEFMDYTVRVLRKCKQYGFRVYMDPHQDVWSRFSGGSGAPFWTLAACGIDPRNFTATQAAIIHCEYPLAHAPDPASTPAMVWSTNYGRLLSQTMFTLFFAGRDFAPKCIIDGQNIQDYLQTHFIEAMGQMADRIRDAGDLLEDCVIGWDSMNEPFEGLCSWKDLNTTPDAQGSTLKKGTYPTPAQSFRLGMGQPQTLDNWSFSAFGPKRNGSVTVDPKGLKIWAEPETEGPDGVHPKWGWKRDPGWTLGTCLWALHGVWDIDSGYILRPDYFRYLPTSHMRMLDLESDEPGAPELEFVLDYWKPHFELFATRIRRSHPEAILFVQPPVFAPPPPVGDDIIKGRAAFSGHYYDGLTLITRHWNWFNADALGLLRGKYSNVLQAVKVGENAIRKSLQEQLAIFKDDAKIIGLFPTIIGEIGTPFDMDDKRSYGWTDGGKHAGDYSRQEKALDASLNGCDGGNAHNWTVWTYCPDSSHAWGDGWNMEDLSLWSPDDVSSDPRLKLYRDDDASRASLLHKNSVTGFVQAAAGSTLSLASVGLGAVMDEVVERQKNAMALRRWKDSPYDFLTDGARAFRAFCRPWPTKVVGRSLDIQFDIKKAYFKLVVEVTSDDQLVDGGVEEAKPGTEVFVPLVHFAHPRLLEPRAVSSEQHTRSTSVDSTSSNGPKMAISESTSVNLVTLLPSSSSSSSESSSHTLHGPESDLLDVEVTVSDGTWTIEGQILKWLYDVPEQGAPARQHTIEIRRAGGYIKTETDQDGYSLCPEQGGCTIA
ncbi:glycoside hydrolase family 5 protein [Mycena floridula]|nr:glycoside hydrolase family 5 protein [Mycena floridula]